LSNFLPFFGTEKAKGRTTDENRSFYRFEGTELSHNKILSQQADRGKKSICLFSFSKPIV
jgi:hypothetical protein